MDTGNRIAGAVLVSRRLLAWAVLLVLLCALPALVLAQGADRLLAHCDAPCASGVPR